MPLDLTGPFTSADGAARFVVRADDGGAFEVVSYAAGELDSVCLSAQAGCGYGCQHCATTFADVQFQRSLTSTEIVASAEEVLARTGRVTAHTVDFSGIGDASRNWANVAAAGQELIARGACERVTVTTVAPQRWVRDRLAGGWLPAKVRISLHGATRASRRLVVTFGDDPERVVGLWEELAERVPVALNYVLHAGNTSPADVEALARLLDGRRFSALRLSPLIVVPGSPIAPADDPDGFVAAVRAALPDWSIDWFQPLGADAESACGQLRVRLR